MTQVCCLHTPCLRAAEDLGTPRLSPPVEKESFWEPHIRHRCVYHRISPVRYSTEEGAPGPQCSPSHRAPPIPETSKLMAVTALTKETHG